MLYATLAHVRRPDTGRLTQALASEEDRVDLIREALKQVRNGKTRFAPETETAEGLRSFQEVAAALKSASNSGYIHATFIESGKRGTHGYTLEAIVSGSLTHEGLQYLAPVADVSLAKASDIIQLKPNIYGLGIDLRAAYGWLIRKLRKL